MTKFKHDKFSKKNTFLKQINTIKKNNLLIILWSTLIKIWVINHISSSSSLVFKALIIRIFMPFCDRGGKYLLDCAT